MLRDNYVGRVEDTFVFTHNNDVVTWSRCDGLQKVETGYELLADAELFSDGVLITGSPEFNFVTQYGHTDVSHIDINDGRDTIETIYADYGGNGTTPLIYVQSEYHRAMINTDFTTMFVLDDWTVITGV